MVKRWLENSKCGGGLLIGQLYFSNYHQIHRSKLRVTLVKSKIKSVAKACCHELCKKEAYLSLLTLGQITPPLLYYSNKRYHINTV